MQAARLPAARPATRSSAWPAARRRAAIISRDARGLMLVGTRHRRAGSTTSAPPGTRAESSIRRASSSTNIPTISPSNISRPPIRPGTARASPNSGARPRSCPATWSRSARRPTIASRPSGTLAGCRSTGCCSAHNYPEVARLRHLPALRRGLAAGPLPVRASRAPAPDPGISAADQQRHRVRSRPRGRPSPIMAAFNSELFDYAGHGRYNVVRLPFRTIDVGPITARTPPPRRAGADHRRDQAEPGLSSSARRRSSPITSAASPRASPTTLSRSGW